jgi:alanyl-tRNA synthetase
VGLLGASVADGRVSLVAAVNPKGRSEGMSAKELLTAALPAVGGRGGGKDDLAQGGGSSPAGVDQAFAAARRYVEGL